jgi:hypothetical protein
MNEGNLALVTEPATLWGTTEEQKKLIAEFIEDCEDYDLERLFKRHRYYKNRGLYEGTLVALCHKPRYNASQSWKSSG